MKALLIGLLAAVLAVPALAAAPALAAQTHVFEETLGSAAKPTFSGPVSIAVDQATGDVLVIEAGAQRISRYHSDGTPANFSALSATNFIDGKAGEADATPQTGLGFDGSFGQLYSQIAVDDSGTVTDGDIYVTQNLTGPSTVQAIDVFASSGEYLGQLSGGGGFSFGQSGSEISPCGVAVDPGGNLYVGAHRDGKIYKYDPAANPPLNGDYVAGFVPAIEKPCQLAAGAGPSAGSLFVRDYGSGVVSKLSSSSGALAYDVFPISGNARANEEAKQIAVNPADGHLFVATGGGSSRGVFDFDASGSSGATLSSAIFGGGPLVAVEEAGGRVYLRGAAEHLDVYSPLVPLPDLTTATASNIEKTTATANGMVETNGEELTECFFEYGLTTAYGSSKPCAESFAQIGTGFAKVHADLSGLSQETVYHYRLVAGNLNGRGDPGKDQAFQTKSKPQLLGEWSEDVSVLQATLKAQLNPQGADTTYRFEWGLTAAPYEHASADVAIGSEPTPHTVTLLLRGLAAGTTYHYRLLAENEMGSSEGLDHTLATFPPSAAPATDCPNQALRTGESALLPDCRAYEMVSPVDKNGGDIRVSVNGECCPASPNGYVQASPDGARIAYATAFYSFAGEPNAFAVNQYLATRRAGQGWASEGIHPPVAGGKIGAELVFGVAREFIAFTPDLCSAWLADVQTPPPTADGQQGYHNLYRRQNCGPGAGGLEALVPSPAVELPPGTDEKYADNEAVQGVSADARHALFAVQAKLTADARPDVPSVEDPQIYDRFGGALHLVSVLPDGSGGDPAPGDGEGFADPAGAAVGGGWYFNLEGAVSSSGTRVYWTSGGGAASFGDGQLYLRLHPEQGIVSEECATPAVACTLPVSATNHALFWQASPEGGKALYSEQGGGSVSESKERLFEFDLAKREAGENPRRLITAKMEGVAGASRDLSRVYFTSRTALPGAGANSEGKEAAPGAPNLYLAEGGAFHFVATLLEGDVGAAEPGAGSLEVYDVAARFHVTRATRVSADGSRIAFESRAPLTRYDNTDTPSGKPAVEVYAYEAGGELLCVSCNPSGARPATREMTVPYLGQDPDKQAGHVLVRAAAWIPGWEHALHASNLLSADGNRLFFNSNDALLPRDANGTQDVYEWEAPGSGRCDVGDADFFAQNGGCLYLISSGLSPRESGFWEASAGGADVFFTTTSSLLSQDPGSIDLYDARVEGGFPPPARAAECEGEACQSPPAPPEDPTPASSVFEGAGNVHEGAKPRCRKPKLRRHGRCVAGKHRNRRANHKRSAPR